MPRVCISVLFLSVTVFLSVCACDDPPPAPHAADALSSRVELAAGAVTLHTGDAGQPVISGAMLPEQADLSVGSGGRALLHLSTGAALFVGGDSRLTLNKEGAALARGRMWVDAPSDERALSRFTAGGVSVTAAGTGFDLSIDAQNTVAVYVARGLAVVDAPGGRVEVQSGEQAIVRKSAAPELLPVSFFDDWTGGMADRELTARARPASSGSLVGIHPDRPGALPEPLQISHQNVEIDIRDGIATTTVDQVFFNPTGAALEGWYWFTAPDGAAIERFAWEVNGQLVEGAVIERRQAAAAYAQALAARVFEPALLEWVDGRTFRARIYPVPATGSKRIVISYRQLLPLVGGVYRYIYPMTGAERIAEFSLRATLDTENKGYRVATLTDARVETDRSAVTMRRSGFTPRSDFMLELQPLQAPAPLRVLRYNPGNNEADYVMIRLAPEVNWESVGKMNGDVVVVLDTSAGGDDADRQVRMDAVEAIIRALSDKDRFAVMTADIAARQVFPAEGLAPATPAAIAAAMEALANTPSSGATDLGAIFGAALGLLHESHQPAVVYVGDGNATVGELTSDALTDRLRRSMGDARARLFTLAVGADADHALLDRLARTGGGRSFRIDSPEQTVSEALRFAGMLKTPTITDLRIDAGAGLDQLFSTAAGKLSQGDEIVLTARTHHALPEEIRVTGRLGGEKFEKTYRTDTTSGRQQNYLPSIWARMYLERLMGEGALPNRGNIVSLGLRYGIMTPYTSFLVLDSMAAYEQQGIPRPMRQLSDAADDDDTVGISLTQVLSVPLGLFGCAEMKDSAPQEAAAPQTTKEAAVSRDMAGAMPPAPESMPGRGAGSPALSSAEGIGTSGGGLAKREAPMPARRARAARDEEENEKAPVIAIPAPGGGRTDSDRNITDDAAAMFKTKGICSDAATRPLSEKRVLWTWRLQAVPDASGYIRVFTEAGERCELPRFVDRRTLLELIEQRVHAPSDVAALLSSFARYPSMQSWLRRRIMRRTLDATLHASWAYGVNWAAITSGLAALKSPPARLTEIRRLLDIYPDEPAARRLLVAILVENEMNDEALTEASRLKRDGQATPIEVMTLCDLLAGASRQLEARRTCSELVEFAPSDPSMRQTLGDVFLRHGWYEDAYRQYATLVDMTGQVPTALMRLAMAAAGMGRIDEALRIERKITASDGEPGPEDPRRFARMHSVARLAAMIVDARSKNDDTTEEALVRSLKRTGSFTAPSAMRILVWEDLEAALALNVIRDGTRASAVETIHGGNIGVSAVDMGSARLSDASFEVTRENPTFVRPIKCTVYTVVFDGKRFSIDSSVQTLSAGTRSSVI